MRQVVLLHRDLAVGERFVQALTDVVRSSTATSSRTDVEEILSEASRPPLVLADAALIPREPATARGGSWVAQGATVLVFAESVTDAADARRLASAGITGFVSEHVAPAQIVQMLAPFLFPQQFDRRLGPRVALAVPVTYRVGERVASSHTLDVSIGGLGMATIATAERGQPVHVRFRLPGKESEVEADCRVVWSRSGLGMGLGFGRVPAESQAAIDEHVGRAARLHRA